MSSEGPGPGCSYIALIGTICSVNPANRASPQRFTLRSEDGFFSIHLEPELSGELTLVLRPSLAVCVVGQMMTYFQLRRQTHQVIVHAISVRPVEPDQAGPALLPALISLVKLVTDQVPQVLAVSPNGEVYLAPPESRSVRSVVNHK